MKQALTEIREINYTDWRAAILEALRDRQLQFLAGNLRQMGFGPDHEVLHAVERAMRVCMSSGLPIREHFKPVYISHRHTVSRDWLLSRLAYTLVMLNGAPDNPLVSRLQLSLIREALGEG